MIRSRVGLAAVALVLACGCATAPPPRAGVPSPLPGSPAVASPAGSPTATPTSPMPGTRVGTTASGGQITTTSPQPTVLDTLPSADALAVLESIPEPLAPAERVPPPVPEGGPAPAADAPSSGPASADSTAEPASRDVPVPAPTRALGDRPTPARLDSVTASPPASPASSSPASSQPARGDSCWRVQVAAVPEAERAQALREAAESQLLVAWVVEIDSGLRKVRSRDCLGAEAADRLRQRAVGAGFSGAFRFKSPAR